MKNKKILAIFSCLILIAIIPMAAGATNTSMTDTEKTNVIAAGATDEITPEPQTTGLFGRFIIRGFVFAWKEYGNQVHTRAIRVHYTTWGPGEHTHGWVIGKEIIFKDRFAIDQMWSGPVLGLCRWVFGIYHGEFEIRG